MDLVKDARRLAAIGTAFIVVGWVAVFYAVIAGLIWWFDLAGRTAFNFVEAFAISGSAVGLPIFVALVVAGLGYMMRVLALYVAGRSQ